MSDPLTTFCRPQSPLHTKSLTIFSKNSTNNELQIVKVVEQRISNLAQGCMFLAFCFYPFSEVLRQIPTSVLYGFFIFLGIESVDGNRLYSCVVALCACDVDSSEHAIRAIFPWYNPTFRDDYTAIASFTTIQVLAVGIIFGVTHTPAGLIFPVLIGALVVLRVYVMPSLLSAQDIARLDPYEFKEEHEVLPIVCIAASSPLHLVEECDPEETNSIDDQGV